MKTGSSSRLLVGFYIYKLNSRDPSTIYAASAVGSFVLLFSFSIFSDHRSLVTKNKK